MFRQHRHLIGLDPVFGGVQVLGKTKLQWLLGFWYEGFLNSATPKSSISSPMTMATLVTKTAKNHPSEQSIKR